MNESVVRCEGTNLGIWKGSCQSQSVEHTCTTFCLRAMSSQRHSELMHLLWHFAKVNGTWGFALERISMKQVQICI